MEELLDCLKNKHLTIGSCESFTAGLFCAKLAEISGASAVLKGGIVTYATDIKTNVVGVSSEVVEKDGVISSSCAKEMALKTKKMLGCDICVSFTGNAGPSAMEKKPAGLVYIGIAYKDECRVYEQNIKGNRNTVREDAIFYAANKIKEWIQEIS